MFRPKTREKNEAHTEYNAFLETFAVFEIIETKLTLCVHCKLMTATHLRTVAER